MTKLLTQREAAEKLGISVETLRHLRYARAIGYVRYGHKTVRFRPEDLEEYQRRVYVPAKPSNI